jgi:hypothetical protein
MAAILPEGEELRRAVKWISGEMRANPDKTFQKLVNDAVFQFDLSPKDAEYLIAFYRKGKMDAP